MVRAQVFTGGVQLTAHSSKVGIFGGTFNPIHLGHTYIAKCVREEFALGKVYMLPTGDPPHKSHILDKEQRYAMLELAVKDTPYLLPSRLEMDRPGKSYTVDTLNRLKQLNEKSELHFIIGSDTLLEIHTWKDVDEVFNLCEFICVLRAGDDLNLIAQTINTYFSIYNKHIQLSTALIPDISSTQIREKIRRGENTDGLLHPLVQEYIAMNGVYQ